MLRLQNNPQLTLLDVLLPPELSQLSKELATVDALLEDERFLKPFVERFRTKVGRPTVPIETYLRLMYLKHRYGLGYETLVKEVADSFQWRRFCRIPLHVKVPHPTTLSKMTKRYGPEVIAELNEALVDKAREKRIVRGKKLQVDTTVVPADIHHPTDAGLLSDGVRVITRTVKRIQEAGAAVQVKFRDRRRSVKKKILAITKVLKRRSQEAYSEVRQITQEILDTTEKVVKQATEIVNRARVYSATATGAAAEKVRRLTQHLEETLNKTARIIGQTRQVQEGNRHLPDRVVSLFDDQARPIKKGKLAAPVEFGYKVLVAESENKIISDYQVVEGNPPDESLLVDAVDRSIQKFHHPPEAVAADRGFGSAKNEKALQEREIKKIAIPRKGRITASRKDYQKQRWFRRLQRWRAGGEATVSVLKRKYGLNRSRLRGTQGTRIWVGWGVMAYNLRRMAAKA